MLIQSLPNLRQLEPALRAHGLQRCIFFKRIGRSLEQPGVHQNQRQAIPGPVHSGINGQSTAKRDASLTLQPELLQGVAQIEPAGRFLRACLREQMQALDGLVKTSALCVQVSPTCERVVVKRSEPKNLLETCQRCVGATAG